MQQRYATNPEQLPRFDTDELRAAVPGPRALRPGEMTVVLHPPRPGRARRRGPRRRPTCRCPTFDDLRADYFLEHRELGIINVGGTGTVTADGEVYTLPNGACLYLGRGIRDVVFADAGRRLRQFYLFCAPAHTTYPAALVLPGEGTVRELGDQLTCNRRTLNQYIHENGVRSCQIVMGVTELHPGSMWNTMPAHTHDRRTECYLYFDLPEDARVIHLMGEPAETRHLVVADRQAVISPSWSIHSGVGTAAYSFVWAMAGENQSFDDMDAVPVTSLR